LLLTTEDISMVGSLTVINSDPGDSREGTAIGRNGADAGGRL
jgi:hypothetical protein